MMGDVRERTEEAFTGTEPPPSQSAVAVRARAMPCCFTGALSNPLALQISLRYGSRLPCACARYVYSPRMCSRSQSSPR